MGNKGAAMWVPSEGTDAKLNDCKFLGGVFKSSNTECRIDQTRRTHATARWSPPSSPSRPPRNRLLARGAAARPAPARSSTSSHSSAPRRHPTAEKLRSTGSA
ncbi:UNVERIFIED_CONTAM: hypothetical protein Sradi_6382900 [Sesamum radiatum]|uniref:Uncharacterized protein n=1 Tax=Sesamum radiatum TaxID=300843 RepID=A0AAW2K507_SESRA